jgi:hypothetical protein
VTAGFGGRILNPWSLGQEAEVLTIRPRRWVHLFDCNLETIHICVTSATDKASQFSPWQKLYYRTINPIQMNWYCDRGKNTTCFWSSVYGSIFFHFVYFTINIGKSPPYTISGNVTIIQALLYLVRTDLHRSNSVVRNETSMCIISTKYTFPNTIQI